MKQISLSELSTEFSKVGEKYDNADLSRTYEEVHLLVIQNIHDNFSSQKSPEGIPWMPPKKPQSHPLLVRSGRLKDSSMRLRDGEIQITKRSYSNENNTPYAEFQAGGTNSIPARPFHGISSETIISIENMVADYIDSQISF